MWVGEEDRFTAQTFAVLGQFVESQYVQVFMRAPETDMVGLALRRFLSRPYLSRSWITQEVVVSTRAFLVCGSLTMSFDTFIFALICLLCRYRQDLFITANDLLELAILRLTVQVNRTDSADLIWFTSSSASVTNWKQILETKSLPCLELPTQMEVRTWKRTIQKVLRKSISPLLGAFCRIVPGWKSCPRFRAGKQIGDYRRG